MMATKGHAIAVVLRTLSLMLVLLRVSWAEEEGGPPWFVIINRHRHHLDSAGSRY